MAEARTIHIDRCRNCDEEYPKGVRWKDPNPSFYDKDDNPDWVDLNDW
jgi:hypothetical protein